MLTQATIEYIYMSTYKMTTLYRILLFFKCDSAIMLLLKKRDQLTNPWLTLSLLRNPSTQYETPPPLAIAQYALYTRRILHLPALPPI